MRRKTANTHLHDNHSEREPSSKGDKLDVLA